MPTPRRRQGDLAESAAGDYLQRAGLRIVAANAGCRAGELDLVMLDGETLVFVEVRYRRSAAFGGGGASIDAGKRRRIVHAAQVFLAGHRQYARHACRFDVVVASGAADAPTLHWLKDAFRADDC